MTVRLVLFKLEPIKSILTMEIRLTELSGAESLAHLRVEHRDLDQVISFLISNGFADQDLVHRLKVRKLNLRDRIARLEPNVAAAAGN